MTEFGRTFLGRSSLQESGRSAISPSAQSSLHTPFQVPAARCFEIWPRSALAELVQQACRVLQVIAHDVHESRADGAVHDSVVERAGDVHHHANLDLFVADWHDSFLRGADRDNGGVGRVDDRREVVDVQHSHVADAERAALHLVGEQLAVSRFRD